MIVLGGWPNRVVLGTGRYGVRPDEFATLGDFPCPLSYQDGVGDAATEFAWVITSLPSDGTATANDDGGFSHVGAADGSYTTGFMVGAWPVGGPAEDRGTGIITTTFGDLAITPGAGALVLAGLAPSAIQNAIRQPGAGALVLAGLAPTVTQNSGVTVNPLTGALIFAGLTPTVSTTTSVTATPSAGALALAGLAPLVTQAATSPTLSPAAGTLALDGLAPSIEVTGGDTVLSAKYLGRPNVHISGGKRKRKVEEPLPAQITNMPDAPAPRGRGLGLEALDAVAPATPASPAPPAAPAVAKTLVAPPAEAKTSEPSAPAPTRAAPPKPPRLVPATAADVHAQVNAAVLTLMQGMEAASESTSDRLVEALGTLTATVGALQTEIETERKARDLKERNLVRARQIAERMLKDLGPGA